ncbi:LacI family DNA-binding transcriptional regulator [Devosia sp. CN2-171]|uniref:LacI family DNA-binding transcriptional regulator n=1 Tax=Devosia sp. CN2-171 TaxID=3400909 RepID=UPI003BF8A07C
MKKRPSEAGVMAGLSKKRVTLADVARLAGLSSAAASMILTGRPDTRLSAEAHRRVHEAAAQLGYRPNLAAQALRTDKTRTIAFISDYVATTRYANGLIRGALAAAQEAGHVLLLLETGGEPDREVQAIEAALDRQVDGIIFAAMRAREIFVPTLPAATPVVMLNGTSSRFPLSVLPDERTGGRSSVELLVAAGHRDGIALVGHNQVAEQGLFRSETVARRIAGIHAAMTEHGLRFAVEESCWEWEPHHGFELTRKILAQRPDVTALLCLNDRLAFGAYQALAEAGRSVPGDISIVAFDNDEIAGYLRPGLTTIALPHEEMGRASVRLLLSPDTNGEHLVSMPVVVRASI